MSLQHIEDSKTLRAYCKKLDREGVALRIIEIAKSIADGDDDEYQSTLRKAGMIRALAMGACVDSYWGEKQNIGFQRMVDEARKAILK